MEGSSTWGQNNLKFKSRPVSYLRWKSEDEMTDSIKGSKGRQCDKVQSGDGRNNSNRITIVLTVFPTDLTGMKPKSAPGWEADVGRELKRVFKQPSIWGNKRKWRALESKGVNRDVAGETCAISHEKNNKDLNNPMLPFSAGSTQAPPRCRNDGHGDADSTRGHASLSSIFCDDRTHSLLLSLGQRDHVRPWQHHSERLQLQPQSTHRFINIFWSRLLIACS